MVEKVLKLDRKKIKERFLFYLTRGFKNIEVLGEDESHIVVRVDSSLFGVYFEKLITEADMEKFRQYREKYVAEGFVNWYLVNIVAPEYHEYLRLRRCEVFDLIALVRGLAHGEFEVSLGFMWISEDAIARGLAKKVVEYFRED